MTSRISGWIAAAEGYLMELNGWTYPQMLRRYGGSGAAARALRSYDRAMEAM